MTRQTTSGYISKGNGNYFEETWALPCSLQGYSQQPRHGSNLSVLMDEWTHTVCTLYIYTLYFMGVYLYVYMYVCIYMYAHTMGII